MIFTIQNEHYCSQFVCENVHSLPTYSSLRPSTVAARMHPHALLLPPLIDQAPNPFTNKQNCAVFDMLRSPLLAAPSILVCFDLGNKIDDETTHCVYLS